MLVGKDALPDRQRVLLEIARYIREFILLQYAYHEVDTYCSPEKMYDMMKAVKELADIFYKALEMGRTVEEIENVEGRDDLMKSKYEVDYKPKLEAALEKIRKNLLGG